MASTDGRRRDWPRIALVRGYGVTSLGLIGLYPFLPGGWREADLLLVSAAAFTCVGYGRRTVRRDRRRPWTLLLYALVALVAANLLAFVPDERAVAAGRLVDVAGYLLVLAAALSLIIRRGTTDLGGVIDAAVIAIAAGSLLWVLFSNRLDLDQSFPAQLNLFVVVFVLTGVLGALLRLAHSTNQRGPALWWLTAAIGLAIAGTIVLAVAGNDPTIRAPAVMTFMAAYTATALFALDPGGPRLMHPPTPSPERLTPGRLAFLGVAVAIIPVVIGIRDLLTGDTDGALLAVQGMLVALLVIARIGLLSAQRTRAEQALQHQATHDPLTHLPNRSQFIAQLRDKLARNTPCVLLFCDLDGFKTINDRFGHDAGDGLLIEVARRMQDCASPPHVVSRFGGDEFVVLLIDATPPTGHAVSACIETALRRPFPQANGAGIGVSIGIAHTDNVGHDPEHLIRSADRAMYRAKTSR
ncbi:MAG TPA: GGDEF domain-containing protein [Jiangellales bacterium]|nr:GGDEF domain-containing protein [Jiangellales bacterium]